MSIVQSFFNPSSRWYYPLRWLVIILLGLAVYGQTFGYSFVFDDNYFILDTPYIRSFDQINQIWAILPKTRLVGIYSLALNYYLNQLDPQGYHIFNFLIHLLAAGLVWACATVLFKIAGQLPQELPFLMALIFLVHPCQTQAVTYISQRFESMATVFYLASIYAYLRARISSSLHQRNVLFTCSMGCAILGILTKEVAVTIPLMMLAIEFILLNRKPFNSRKSPSRQFYILVTAFGVIFVLLFMKMAKNNFINAYFHFSQPSESHEGDIITGGKYVLTQMRVFLTFLRLLILPVNQNLDYDYPLSTGLLNPPLTLVGLGLMGFIAFLVFRLRKQWPLISFGLAWILITFSINTVPRVNVIFEHKLYLISFGFFLLVVCALSLAIKDRKTLFGLLIALIAVLSVVSYKRNQVWKDDFTLWSDTARKSPHKARPYNSLGVYYGMQGNFIQSIVDLNKAIEINPAYAEAYNNRGNSYLKEGNYTQAIVDLNKAIKIKPDYVEAYTNLGKAYSKRGLMLAQEGRFTQAMSDFNKAIKINPEDGEAYINRGVIFAQQSNDALALFDYDKAIGINPENIEAYINRGIFYAQQGKFTQALSDYSKAVNLNPDFNEIYSNRSVIYYQLKQYDKSWSDVNRAEALGAVINPEFIDVLKQASGIK